MPILNPGTNNSPEKLEKAAVVAYGEAGKVSQAAREGERSDKAGIAGMVNKIGRIIREAVGGLADAGDNVKKIYIIHSHPYDTGPTRPYDYEPIKEVNRVYGGTNIGIVAAPHKVFIYDDKKVIATIDYPKK